MGGAVSLEIGDLLGGQTLSQLEEQARLAGTRLTLEHDDVAVARRANVTEAVQEERELGLAAHEGAEAAAAEAEAGRVAIEEAIRTRRW
jgi:hypothetical protein